MINITIVGAGVHGARMATKYGKFPSAHLKAIISPREPKAEIFLNVPHFTSAESWREKFGKPGKGNVFDLCVHGSILMQVLSDLVSIGAKNFIFPKPIALKKSELVALEKILSRNKLNVLVASQWTYSSLVEEISRFVKTNKKNISSVEVVFSRSFNPSRKESFSSLTAFLPHIVQILFNTHLINKKSPLAVERFTRDELKYRYFGRTAVRVRTSISGIESKEHIKIFLKGEKKPAFIADFMGVLGRDGFIKFPSFSERGQKREVREDILEKMIGKILTHFSGNRKSADNFKKYLPVAEGVAKVSELANNLVVVVGGGIFGALAALEVAKRGYSVIILEKSPKLITGASLVNQCRVHMGYHYPRDEKTARDSCYAKNTFEKIFSKAVVKDVNNHYLVAKEDSLTKGKDFEAFCKKLNLPYKESWPKEAEVLKDKIALSFKVPERIFDANVIREILEKKIAETQNVTLVTGAEVFGIKKGNSGYEVQFNRDGEKEVVHATALVNAAYGNINHINEMAGLELQDYQYELCEVPVASTPWRKTGWAIIDGPFFGIMPFGFSKNYLFYDVELSVLERVVGKLPVFKKSPEYYDQKKRREKRFDEFKKKWKPWFPDVEKCRPVSSMYVTRIVLPKKEKTDTRPTIVEEMAPGFWQVFSGKITMSVPKAIELADVVHQFLKKNK